MTLCTLMDDMGTPPENCVALRGWVWELVTRLAAADNIRCGTGVTDPDSDDLDDLWGTCAIPPGSLAIWYNSVSGDTLYYLCFEGSLVGCTWTEFTL